jgi:hypothetical protein
MRSAQRRSASDWGTEKLVDGCRQTPRQRRKLN